MWNKGLLQIDRWLCIFPGITTQNRPAPSTVSCAVRLHLTPSILSTHRKDQFCSFPECHIIGNMGQIAFWIWHFSLKNLFHIRQCWCRELIVLHIAEFYSIAWLCQIGFRGLFVCLFSRWGASKSKKNVTGLRCSSAVEHLPSIHENLWLVPASQTRKRRGKEREGKRTGL